MGPNEPLVLRVEWTKLQQIWGDHLGPIIDAPNFVLDIRYVPPFGNQNASKTTTVEHRGQHFALFTTVKIRRSVDEMPGVHFSCQASVTTTYILFTGR